MLIGCCAGLSSIQVLYFAIQFCSDQFGFDIYSNNMFQAVGEFIGLLLLTFLINRMPRKTWIIIFLSLSGLLPVVIESVRVPLECRVPELHCD